MKKNEGTFDRVVRVLVGLVIIAAGFKYGSYWGAIGLIPLITGLIGYCHLYAMLGMSTCKKK